MPDVRFANREPVNVVDDRRDVPKPPTKRKYFAKLHHYDSVVHRPITRALALSRSKRALGVNSFDEVPDSTWFTNRIGARDMTLDELRAGSATGDSPELHKPWTIMQNKASGDALGFVVRDARGIELMLKLDRKGYAEIESGAAVITGKLLWAAGYNLPEEHVVYVQPRDLIVTADSKYVDRFGRERQLEQADVERVLARCEVDTTGALRGLASRMLGGEPLGGHPAEGTRRDDPNDRIPHERRRDLRGAYPIFAWLDHADMKDGNTLDIWVEDPRDPSLHYVKHYLIDFGKSLGVLATMSPNKRLGHAYSFDIAEMVRSLASGGLGVRPWDDRPTPRIRGVGLFEARTYHPGEWKPLTPGYVPFLAADARDKLWGAKILMRFTPAQLRAIVETARFTDPRAVDYITRTLIARQRATARYWFERASPLDRFSIEDGRLCFDDLAIAYALEPRARYVVTRYDEHGRAIGSKFALHHGARGRTCFPVGMARGGDGYTILAISRSGRLRPLKIYVHVARDPGDGTPRVIGLWRP